MGKPFWRSVEYFFTGNYSADDGNNNIVAIGFGGQIHAYGGDDHVTVGSIGATVYTGSGNDTVVGGSAYLKVEDSTGHLTVKGAAGYADINKSGDGNVSFAGAAGGVSIDHLGNHGDVNYGGAAAYNGITRKGLSGNVTFKGAGGYNALWHETNQGNLSFAGAGAGNKLDRTWFNRYQGSRGDVTFDGAGAANSISSRVETGNITFRGAGADNHLVRKGKVGDITLQGAGASNRIERTRQAEDVYAQTRGNIRFEGVGGYNSLYSDVAHGDIHFSGGGAYNTITRKGSGSSFDAQGMEYAKAEDIVLTAAQMHGLSIDNGNKFHAVTAVKSEREPNTYLFAIADGTYTKINKVRLYNDPETGKLKYYSEAWFKRGNHLAELARSDVSSAGGFEVNPINGGYTLSNIAVEHQQSLTVHAVEKDLTEYEWVTYANGALIDAKDVALSDAKMGGHAISTDGTTVDVQAVKSNRKPNTYVYAKVLGPYTKIVVVELANDPKTGALKYQARSWYKEGNHTANLANEDISSANGYHSMGKGGYSLSDLHYSVNAVRSTSETVADIDEYTDQTLFKPATDSGESSGDVRFNGAGGGNVIKSNVTRGNVYFNGGGIANVILHSSQFGHTEFNGGGAANVIVKSGEEGDLTFRGAGLANVLVHQSKQGKMDVYAGGAVNVLVRIGDGQYLAHLLAYGNISVHKGNGNSRVVMLGGYNTHTQIGSGNGLWLAAGGFNVMTQVGKGDVASVLAGGANVLTKMGEGELTSGMLGGANVITHISGDNETSNTTAVALGGANILTKKGKGNTLAVMGGGANVLTHVGDGTTTGVMVGGANILTKVGNGDTTGIMLGVGNVLTHVGDGQTLGVMGAAGNIFTKVGDGTSIAVMIGAGNIFTHVGEGNAWALMGGLGNVFTKVGNGDALALMVAEANVFTHIGDGMSVALMLAKGNVATKVGNGTTLAAMVGNANIFTHVGSGSTFAAMIGQANIMTKVGNDLTAALMVGKANIMTHVGDGTSLGLFAGEVNVMTKVGNGTTLAAMFGKANIMTHVGDGLTGVLALGEANIVTKVGDDFMGVVAAAKANVVTHVGDATTAAVLAGKGNILTKVGEGTTVGLLISDVGNVMTHVGDGTTIGIAKGKANLITKVGDGLGVNVAWGQANVFTQVGDGDRYNFAKGEANLITKVGDGQELSVVQGEANIITHVGNGDDYTGAWGKANVITKVGHGQNVVLAKGEANIVTQVGDGDSFNALWSKGNIVTKVGDGMQVTAAKGQANITTTVGNGLSVTAAYGDANINTKVGDGVSVNVAWGKYNINTKVGDGLNVAVMKGKANANIHVGDGLNINASYAQNNVAIKVGNGDFYSLAVASSNTSSNKLSALFDNIKQTVLGVGGSQAINYLVQGDEASSSGTHKGRGAIATPEITKLDGFQMDAIKEVGSDLGDSLTGSVTKVDTPDLNKMQHALNVDDSSVQASNLIVNGDFELGEYGWQSTHGVEASYAGSVYGVEGEGHGARVTELDTYTNTSLYQDLANLAQGEVIAVSFDFAKRAGLSNNEGIEVLWNGEVVFSSSGDESAWQQKTLKLTAQAGSNRIEFKGTGHNDGLGYILDNVVATSESSQQANAIREHATQNPAAQNALSDKERAEADRQRLEQEKQKQLDAVAGSQSQLESTDQQALENNGQAQRDAVQEESEAITAELTKLAQGLDVLDSQATHTGESGDQWRNEFASGLLAGVQTQLDDAKQLANGKIAEAKQTHADNQNKVKDAVAKSEAGVAKGEQNRAGAEQDIADAQADAEKRKADALAKGKDAQQAESDAHHAVNNAQSRGDRDVQVAENKANQAQADAQGAKQNEGDRPDRQGVTGSGLSGNAHSVEGAGETDSHVKTDSQTNADGRFSEGLTEQEQEALEGVTNAVNRLQINAGIRAKNSGSTITTMFTEANTDSIVVPTTTSQDVVRKEIRISGVNLEGLGEASHDGTLVGTVVNTMLRESLPFYSLRTERNLLVQEGDEGFEVRAWPGTEDKSKTIILEDPEDAAQHKAIERFILANFDNFEQMPDELFLVDNKVISHHEGRTHVLAQRVDGAWQYNATVELMSVTELLDAANVTGKIRGESYQQVIDALTDYHASITEHADYEPESVEKLLNLRKKIEGYVLGHPDSGRVEAMNSLLNQVNTRLDEVSLLSVAEQTIQAQDSFSRLYDQLEAANLKESKHLDLDQNGDFVTKGKGNLANIDLLGSREAVLEKVKLTVSNEYGQTVADTIFAGLSAKDLAKDGKGIDIAGLNKVHQAIEQHLSPVSATLYIWKPSDHSALGHAALQIGQGRTQLEGQAAADFNQQNYVSWWPLGSKSSNIGNILNVTTKDQPDLKLRWKDFSQPAAHGASLAFDMQTEENDDFGLKSAEDKLKDFIKQLASASGVDKKFKDISQAFTMMALMNPDILESANIPEHISKPFVDQWNDTSYDMQDVALRFAKELQEQAKVAANSEQMEQQISEVVRRFAQDELDKIQTFKETQADQGRVFRINLEGLDVAAMQAEWHHLSNDSDARYQLLTKNCSSMVAKVLKAGGADKLIGHTWLPKFGVWTPTELFNFGQALQEAQLEIAAKKQSHQVTDVLDALSGNKAKVAVDLAQIFTVQELKERAKVFAKPIGASYQGILDQLDLVHQAKGRYQIAASFELNKKINDYIAEHPTSGRNQALTQLKEQVTSALFIGKMQVAQAGIDAIAQTRPELATRIFMVAIEEANGKHVGLTDMMLRWANEDPYLAPKHGYKGEMPSDLGFDAKYHVDLGEHYADFKKWLETSQSNGLLSKATLDESTKTVHLGYSYQELQDLTGAESVQMAFYFLKEAAKKADPISGDSAEMILLKKFADQNYLSQLDSDRMDQIEGIYRSSHETDVDAWDRRYSGKGYDELTNMLASATGVDEQLSVLLDDRKGLLIGEVHGSDVNGLRFVNEQMEALKKQGVTVIGLEHLRSDLAQPLIDRYLATGVMSSELSAMLKTKHLDVTLFENARVNGMRIVALDANSSARPNVQGTEHGLMYRAGAANNIAVEVLQNLPDGEKFVAIYGKAHLQSHKGIEGFVPGITHRLDLPALKVSDSNQFTVEQDDVSLRVVYDDVANKPKITFKGSLSGANTALHNQNVNDWERVVVTPIADGGETRFDGQIIVQMENDPVVAKAAANLAGKHAESSVVVQLDSDGNYRVVYGDPSKLDGKLRWQLVGHGRDHSESNNTRLSGYSADELAVKLAKFQQSFNQAENINNKPDHISIVGCSLVSDDKQKGFGHQFINAMDANGLRVDVSVRSSELAVDEAGRKHTKDANGDWVQKAENNKVSLSWDAQGEVVAKDERIRNGIAEGDIALSRIGVNNVDEPARGAIGDNSDVFDAPEKRKPETEVIANSSSSNQLSYSGNIQVNVGEGEFTAVNWGTSNVGTKVGTGGFKSLAFGDNNVMVHIGDGESKHSVDIGGYQALEGAQMFLGNRNVSFNFGHSNDLILMMDKSIPTPPLVNPFDGAARISGVLQGIAMSGEGEDWLAAQEQQWTLSGAKKFVKDMSGLDQSSSVDYTTLVELDSQNERDSRGLKHDAEATLNKQYNQWLSGNGNSGTSQLSRADKLRQANEKLAFNFAVGGQGADIQVMTGNWNFMFGDNIQSILDTNLGSLFGLMTQQFTATGQAKTTFTYTPQDLPRQLKNKLLGQLAGVGAETTLADIFGVDYTASGQIISRNGQAVDGVAILKEMLEVIGEFSGDQLQAFVDPAKLLDSLKAGIDMGADGIKSFAETHGLKEKAPEEEKENSSVSVNGANVNSAQGATVADGNTETAETQDRAFGFNSLNLPNLFATIFSQDKQKEMKSLVENLKQNLTADLLNMKEKTFDFLRNSGHLQGDGDINISLGNYNFNWGGDGKDLGAYLGDNNNFWGGRGDDVFYATGTSNIFTGGEGNDMGVLMGRENMMFGGDGNDTAVVAGRINHVFLGAGDDQSFVFGEGGEIDTGSGRDYVVTSGNFNRVDTGDDQDYSVTIGNNNQVELGAGNDFANVFGNYNRINAGAGNDVVKLMGYHAVLNGGDGDDHLIATAISKFSQFNGGEGRDLMVLGGYQNTFKGGTDVDSFVVSGDVIDNLVEDIRSEDNIVFNGIDWQKLWFERSGYDLKLSILRDPSNDSDQSKFEHIGSVTFSDYFNGNRAQVVIGMSEKDLSGEREYTMLSDSAIDALVQAMSGFEPQAGDNGFIDSLESKSQATISMAWSDVVHKKGLMV
ncbi:MARTX multifunctional-autoprocessing repeats-in-toxin holotoxin RtxA [Vibrio cholerae]|uniref:MARTX multifunctional-autoprocessing repeats-in-toxin holotoxin RtxA n=1 Tax=Vibrio cholerae TaxID=666 RepID=UPI0010FF25D3|nr:MARTX multifunctional-autoprocessing repeats-in-toxin holotoxin RtxA [Vibrio cholerae]TLE10966.1 MARTX multifunctional-autoprocessing repeats-in-toxin holotoxin RtxA [Vibrio cholerae]TLE18054.1 MARTX multifunctional-autoprocessing repeats-in-toxin holotoxin RtxA [Vibrio cholerae]